MLKLIYLSIFLLSSCETLSKLTASSETKATVDGDNSTEENTPTDEKFAEKGTKEEHSATTRDKKASDLENPNQHEGKPVRISNFDDLQHKQALMWARISDLEDQLKEEKAKVELLQKRQRTGLDFKPKRRIEVEEAEFTKPDKPHPVEKTPAPINLSDDYLKIEKNISQEATEIEKKKKSKQDAEEKRNQILAKAQDLYRSGSFGASIAELERGMKDFGDNEDGICTFWIARNWMSLKEYQTASNHLENFSKRFAQSTYIPRAKLELARAQNQLGMRSKALQSYQEVIKKYSGQESAEMAQLELEKLKRNL